MSTPGRQVSRQSPRTVETWVVVMLSEWLVLWCPRPWVGRLASPRLLPEGSQRLRGPGHAEGVSRAARARYRPTQQYRFGHLQAGVRHGRVLHRNRPAGASYPKVSIAFTVDKGHYHVSLLLYPFAYSTYRGS